MFFQSWAGIVRVLLIGPLAYTALIVLLRVSGKRTLSKMNAFDLVITITLGSTLASVLLSKSVPLAEGIAALFLLIFMQFVVAWLSLRSGTICRLVKSEPRLLFYEGNFLRSGLRAERVTESEVLAAVRSQGHSSLHEVGAVVLETDGTLSVSSAKKSDRSALSGVKGSPSL